MPEKIFLLFYILLIYFTNLLQFFIFIVCNCVSVCVLVYMYVYQFVVTCFPVSECNLTVNIWGPQQWGLTSL